MISHKKLLETVSYNKETGEFVWKKQLGPRVPGDALDATSTSGYKKATMYGHQYYLHRLAWFYVYGEWPKKNLDHINRDRFDNRICNLREATNAENLRNIGKRKNNTSGFLGVDHLKKQNKWRATIMVDWVKIHLGCFDTPEIAHAAYVEAAKKYHKEFARWD